MRAWILGALGLGAGGGVVGGCGANVEVSTGGGGSGGEGTTTAPSSGSAQTSSASTGFTSTTTGFNPTATAGSGVSSCGPYTLEPVPPPAEGPCSEWYDAQLVCYPAPPNDQACDDVYTADCLLPLYACGLQQYGSDYCPVPDAPGCCYHVVGDCPVGRPFTVRGAARVAAIEPGAGWGVVEGAPLPDATRLDGPSRLALADFWSREAATEHASVASFSRFVLQLLALGAPADLVQGATRAVAEELEHATTALAFAGAYGGAPLRPAALDAGGSLDGIADPVGAAVSVAREGCVAETVSALQIRAASERATEPAVRSALAKIADQAAEHALLAWRTLAWLLRNGGAELRAAVSDVFREQSAHVGLGPIVAQQGNRTVMQSHGYLPLEERRALAGAALADVVSPCARDLFAALELRETTRAGSREQPAPSARPT